jgi:magnesium-transporting ATPase (P-type)
VHLGCMLYAPLSPIFYPLSSLIFLLSRFFPLPSPFFLPFSSNNPNNYANPTNPNNPNPRYAVQLAKSYMPDYEEVRKPSYARFTPNLINTVVFLVQTMQQVSVLMVNYKGRPFQPSLTESKGVCVCVCVCACACGSFLSILLFSTFLFSPLLPPCR